MRLALNQPGGLGWVPPEVSDPSKPMDLALFERMRQLHIKYWADARAQEPDNNIFAVMESKSFDEWSRKYFPREIDYTIAYNRANPEGGFSGFISRLGPGIVLAPLLAAVAVAAAPAVMGAVGAGSATAASGGGAMTAAQFGALTADFATVGAGAGTAAATGAGAVASAVAAVAPSVAAVAAPSAVSATSLLGAAGTSLAKTLAGVAVSKVVAQVAGVSKPTVVPSIPQPGLKGEIVPPGNFASEALSSPVFILGAVLVMFLLLPKGR